MTLPEKLADLARAFPRTPISEGTFRVYLRELADLPEVAVEEACEDLLKTSLFFPTIREIRETTIERALNLPTEVVALAQIEQRITWARTGNGEPDVHPLVLRVVTRLGGFSPFKTSEQPGAVRREFLRLYRQARREAILGVQTGKVALQSGPTLSIMPPEDP